MFDRLGEISYPAATARADEMFEAVIEAGAENVESDAEQHVVTAAPEDLNAVRDALENRFGPAASARLIWRPKTASPIDEETASNPVQAARALEDSDAMCRTSMPISKWPKT
jgi:transcriptional/translational regulatory protein YebC/TACO1